MLRSSGLLQALRATTWRASKATMVSAERSFLPPLRPVPSQPWARSLVGRRFMSTASAGGSDRESTAAEDEEDEIDDEELDEELDGDMDEDMDEDMEEDDEDYDEDYDEEDDEQDGDSDVSDEDRYARDYDEEYEEYESDVDYDDLDEEELAALEEEARYGRSRKRVDPYKNADPALIAAYEEFLEKGLEDTPDLDIGDSDPIVPYNWMRGMDPREANMRCFFLESDFPHKENPEVRKQIMTAGSNFDPEYDCLPHAERNAIINLVEQYENQGCWHPVINPELKENLYNTWASDKEFWTLDKLSQRFRLKKLRVEAILLLKIEEKRLMRERPEAVIQEGDQIDYMYAMEFGMIGTDGWSASEIDDRYELRESVGGRPAMGPAEEEVDLNKAFQHAFASWKYPNSLPVNPPNPEDRKDGQPIRGPDTRVRNGRKRKPTCKRPKILFVDSSEVPNREMDGLMIVKDVDGSQRHATWDERREFYRKSMTGERARKAFPIYKRALDPIIFPVDDEEEKLMRTQFDDVQQPWARPMFVTDKESFMLSMKGRHPVDRAELWKRSADVAAGSPEPPPPEPLPEDSDIFDIPSESPFEKTM